MTREDKPTILIVDDAPINIELLNAILGDIYEILFATNGEEALEIAISHCPDIILLDVMMPGIDGYETCKRLKADSNTKVIPVIFITAMGHENDEARGLAIGAIDYITKPISAPIVRARVRNHLELKQYRDYLEKLSNLDGLTGIANRRKFDEYLHQEWHRAIRSHNPISLILIDIDYFKKFNDTYGHLTGDDCLKQVCKAFKGTLKRPTDLLARYGGEEFACVLPDTSADGSSNLAHKLRESIVNLKIPHEHSDIVPYVTISLGAATTVPSPHALFNILIEAADQMLYQAKKSGRNKFVQRVF